VYHLELLGFVFNCLNLNEEIFNIPTKLAGFLYVCIHSLNLATLDMDSTKLIFSFVKDRLLEPIQCYKDGDEFSDNKVKEEDNEGRLTRSSSLNDEDVQGEVRETPEKNVVEEVIAEGKSAEDDSIEERDSGSKKDISHNIVHRSIKISSKVVREMRRVPFDYKKIEK
jgi:hypothetical protein